MMKRFGKSIDALLKTKQSFFKNNDSLLAERSAISKIYASQPIREKCKICSSPLVDPSFLKSDIKYFICSHCGHLNGGNEDTQEFCSAVYTDSGGHDYAKTYADGDRGEFGRRVDLIYKPKAEFLFDALREDGVDPDQFNYADLGAGSGHLVAALRQAGKNAVGYEASKAQVEQADRMLGKGGVIQHDLDEVALLANSIKADVVSMIGVLEHLRNPMEALDSMSKNKSIKYIYMSVPLLSVCVFFEMVFKDVMPRNLSGGHTHLFTQSSLEYIENKFAFERVAEWWFGTDMFDLYRSVCVTVEKQDGNKNVSDLVERYFLSAIDSMQLEIDKRKLSSAIHLLWKIK